MICKRIFMFLGLKKIFPLLLIVSAFVCCTTDGLDPVASEDGELADYGFYLSGTKADGDPAKVQTYRAMLHSYGSINEYPYLENSGTYRATASSEKSWLIPCNVDPATGVWTEDSHLAGLRAMRKKYYISFVCPAVAPQSYTYNSKTEWGFKLYRDNSSYPELNISSPVLIDSLKGNHLKNQSVYDFSTDPSAVLMPRRSRIILKIKCDSSIPSITLLKVGLTNRYEQCYYNLRLDTLENFTLSPKADTLVLYNPASPQQITSGNSVPTQNFYLFPLDYSKKNNASQYVYAVPELEILLNTGWLKVKLPRDLKPFTSYECTITIKSTYVGLDLTAGPWTTHSGLSSTID